jgi:peptidoglycan/LPS O-acetylase OafA/YrhL
VIVRQPCVTGCGLESEPGLDPWTPAFVGKLLQYAAVEPYSFYIMAPRIVPPMTTARQPLSDTRSSRTQRPISLGSKGPASADLQGIEKHIDSLDGLRGVAILLVFFFHYLPRNPHSPLSWLASLGWSGVDLFFVLSGFLITGILYDTRGSCNFFKAFYARRALRLFPLYFFAVGLVLSISLSSQVHLTWKAIPFYIYGANVMLLVKDGVPNYTRFLQCIHFWSLALEEQFYSLWPLVIFFVRSRRKLMLICAGGILGALLFRVALTCLRAPTWALYTELPSRMDALLAGSMLALLLRGNPASISRSKIHLLLGGCCLTLVILFIRARTLFLASSEMTTLGYSMFAGAYACVLALALARGTLANRIGKIPALRFFGRYSYGLYVWHDLPSPICIAWWPWFARNIHPLILAQSAYALTMLALFTAVAVASYHLLEIRFLKLKSHFQYTSTKENNSTPIR